LIGFGSNGDEGKLMLANRWIVLAAALVFWTVYFHTIDRLVMNAQGLPVGIDLMPK
jgi:hypothetical protein